MKMSDFLIDNIDFITELLKKGCTLNEVIKELEPRFPKTTDLFGEEQVHEFKLDVWNLASFCKRHEQTGKIILSKEYQEKKDLKNLATRQQARNNVRKDHLAEKDREVFTKLRHQKQRILSGIANSTEAIEMLNLSGDQVDFSDDLGSLENNLNFYSNSKECVRGQEKIDKDEALIPITFYGELRDWVLRMSPYGYTIEQLAELADTKPDIIREIIEDDPEMKHNLTVAKHLIFERLFKGTLKASLPGTVNTFKYAVARDPEEPEKAKVELAEIITQEHRGSPETMFKMASKMGKHLGIPMFTDTDDNDTHQTGVLEVSEPKGKSSWEEEAIKSQKNLKKIEEDL